MSDESLKEARTILRQVQQHLLQAHLKLGARVKSLGFVDVVHHPTNPMSHLNYVTPRRNTAWVSGSHIDTGLQAMRELGRVPRVYFAEGLYPPVFIKSLRELGLEAEYETPIMVYKPGDDKIFRPAPPPPGITLARASDQEGVALWWYVWQNAYYEIITAGAEPLFIGRDLRDITTGGLTDIILYNHGFPAGVARVTYHEKTAHITAQALMKEVRTAELTRLLQASALQMALSDGCEMVFIAGETEANRKMSREMGFVDSGSVVCYAEPADHTNEETHGSLAQSVLIL